MRRVFLGLILVVVGIAGNLCLSAEVMADGSICSSGMDEELMEAAGCNQNTKIEDTLGTLFTPVFSIVAIIAVGAIIYSGFLFIKSNGDPGKIATARHALMYSVIGLIVAVASVVIVQFVAGKLGG